MTRRSTRSTRSSTKAKRTENQCDGQEEEDFNPVSDLVEFHSLIHTDDDQVDGDKKEEKDEKVFINFLDYKGKGKEVIENSGADTDSDHSDELDDYFVMDSEDGESDDSSYAQHGRKITKKAKPSRSTQPINVDYSAFAQQDEEMRMDEDGVAHFVNLNIGLEVPNEELNVHMNEAGEAVDNNAVVVPMKRKRQRKRRGRKGEVRAPLIWELWEDENDDWIDQIEAKPVDSSCQDEEMEATEAPSDLLTPLLRYQKEWLAWALKQEQSLNRGGILADEMGMGKTVQAIALILAQRKMAQTGFANSPNASTALPEIKTTIVICPVVALTQWENEIHKFTPKGSIKVLKYHDKGRQQYADKFHEYDFVLTTYSIVELEYRNNMPSKERCIYCGKLYVHKAMKNHLKYFCGPNAVKTAKQSKQVTKRGKEGSKSFKSKQKLPVLDGSSESEGSTAEKARKKTKKQGDQKSAPGVSSPVAGQAGVEQDSSTRRSILHLVKWNRIILDEAHFIKERRCNTARAVFALESSYRWALSGTPLQNRVGELYSLVRFLQVSPYSYYFCKDCDCKTLDHSPDSQCPNCDHKSVRHFCWWNKFVVNPIQKSGNSEEGRRAMTLLTGKLLKSVVLRRTKTGRAADLGLPTRIVTLRRDTLDIKEEDYYESIYNESQSQFNTYVEAGNLMHNYAHIFDLLTRLRQAVNHPYLVIYSQSAAQRNAIDDIGGGKDCGLCHDPVEDPIVTSCCAQVFCKACLTDYSAESGKVTCPSCSKPLTADFTKKIDPGDQRSKTTVKGFRSASILNRLRLEDFQTSTKIDALREEIRYMIEKDGSAKGIVFSQFTAFLDLIHYSLQKSGISCVQLVGSMTRPARDAAIKRFTEEPDCKIFLMSLKAGGVALNLTVASHVFLMDPWWNPAVESQAQDRIHRIGQYKPIRIVRFIIESTVEERILKLQEKKKLIFEGTVGDSSEALTKLTEADLRFLFS
ncbi:hypothetical protein MKW98_022488 [Papaver atlanticum]|uniref:DNA repair protein RAD16 n=1 Tax=Papaver atlanticum TaxID=357466 RepID=A0AAD4XRZ7_9MAGN|nr:hypothetical protein MKW98_022488 [Papaver atlanticum]